MAAKDEEDSCFSLGWLFTFIRIYFGETLSCQRCFQKMLCVDIKIMMYAIKILLLHTEDIHKGSERTRGARGRRNVGCSGPDYRELSFVLCGQKLEGDMASMA